MNRIFQDIADIHSHTPRPGAVCSVNLFDTTEIPNEGLVSVGFHPWGSDRLPDEGEWKRFEELARNDRVVAIGECGIDLLKGGPLFRQIELFARQAEVAEKTGKPLIIHCVRAHDHIIGLRKEMKPSVPWIIHGFRGKPTVARMFLDAGFYLSYGERFNAESVKITPSDRMFFETDESDLSIDEIINRVRQ